MKNIRSAGIIPNIEKDDGLVFSARIAEFLEAGGCRVRIYIEPEISRPFGQPVDLGSPASQPGLSRIERFLSEKDELFRESDFIAALGGDGTMLRVSHSSAVYGKPVLGINLGHLGYLTDVEKPGAFEALDKVLNGKYTVQNRMMLDIRLESAIGTPYGVNSDTHEKDKDPVNPVKRSSGGEISALNDISISRGVFSKMIYFELRINGEFIDTYRADGIIVSTPTGSTAYNLSAGGPIMKPDADMIAITPICPHMIHSRPHVISANDTVHIKILGSVDDVAVAVDGLNKGELSAGAEVFVSRSRYRASIIHTNTLGFYDILRKKLVEYPASLQ